MPWLVLLGCAGLFAHLCMTKSLMLAKATVVIPMDFVRLPVIAVVGMSFSGEAVNMLIILGALLIFGVNWLNIRSAGRESRAS